MHINISTIFRLFRILGLIAVLSYMIVILFIWMYANHQGYVYFSAGEPISLIKYSELVLGLLGIIATASVLRRELEHEARGAEQDLFEKKVEEHVKNMNVPESTGQQIIDAKTAVEAYLEHGAEKGGSQ